MLQLQNRPRFFELIRRTFAVFLEENVVPAETIRIQIRFHIRTSCHVQFHRPNCESVATWS